MSYDNFKNKLDEHNWDDGFEMHKKNLGKLRGVLWQDWQCLTIERR